MPAGSTRFILNGIFFISIAVAAFSRQEGAAPEATGTLRLSIMEGNPAHATPARVELVDGNGKSCVAEDALQIGGD